ncbi:hypothetical protein EV361DRAFT_214285 [Lentinula raphanica]|nr:hypothetical protein EV361DRAFT_214285 [Lentinula raphanica]
MCCRLSPLFLLPCISLLSELPFHSLTCFFTRALRMSDTKFPIDTAQIVGLFMESVTYGIFFTTFLMCLHGMLYSPTHRFHLKPYLKINYRMLLGPRRSSHVHFRLT